MNNIKNVVVLNDFGRINGGATKVCFDTVSALLDYGMNVHLITGTKLCKNHCFFKYDNFNYDCLNSPDIKNNLILGFINGLWSFSNSYKLFRLINNYSTNDTIVHLHSWVNSLSPSIFYILRKLNLRTFCTLHDYFSCCPNGGYYNYKKNKICTFKALSKNCVLSNCDSRNYFIKLWRLIRYYVQNNLAQFNSSIDKYFTISDFSEKIFSKTLPLHKLKRLNNPMASPVSQISKPYLSDYSLYAGRLTPEKGAYWLAKNLKHLDYNLKFAGSGPDSKKISNESKRYEMLGWLNSTLLKTYLSKCRFLIFPSLWYETQGLVVWEAASHGIPSIVSSRTAASEFVIHGQTGYIFDPDIDGDLCKYVKILFEDDNLLQKLSINSYNHFNQNYNDDKKYLKNLLALYNI